MEPLRTCWTMVVGSDHCNLHTGKNQMTSFKRQQQDKHHLSKMCSPLFFILKSWCTHRSCSCCSWDKTTEPTESDSCLANQRREPWEHIPSYRKYLQLNVVPPPEGCQNSAPGTCLQSGWRTVETAAEVKSIKLQVPVMETYLQYGYQWGNKLTTAIIWVRCNCDCVFCIAKLPTDQFWAFFYTSLLRC